MKTVNYKYFDLNLFKLEGKVVHVPTETLCLIKNPPIPDIACYVQTKHDNGTISGDAAFEKVADLQEYSIKEAVSYFGVSEENFEIKDL